MAGYLGTKAVLLSTTAANVVGNATISGDLTVDTDTLHVDSTNDRVGIGTSSPAALLHLESAEPVIRIKDSDGAAYHQIFGNTSDLYIDADRGNNASSNIIFRNDATERMRIDSSGNVGIGTSSPSVKLDVIGSTTNGSGVVDTLRLRNTGATLNDGPRLQFTAGTSTSGAAIASQGKALNSADLLFYSGGNTERMRIDSSGNVLVGKTSSGTITTSGMELSPNYTMFSGSNSGSNPTMFVGANGASGYLVNFYYGGASVGNITTNGSATAYSTASDYRLKTDAQPMTGASARVQALNPVNFEWIADGTRVDGFLAHEAQEVAPEAVTGTKDAMRDEEYEVTPAVLDDEGNEVTPAVMGTRSVPDYQGIDQSKLVPLLTAALQEALTEIADLKTRVSALEGV